MMLRWILLGLLLLLRLGDEGSQRLCGYDSVRSRMGGEQLGTKGSVAHDLTGICCRERQRLIAFYLAARGMSHGEGSGGRELQLQVICALSETVPSTIDSTAWWLSKFPGELFGS